MLYRISRTFSNPRAPVIMNPKVWLTSRTSALIGAWKIRVEDAIQFEDWEAASIVLALTPWPNYQTRVEAVLP